MRTNMRSLFSAILATTALTCSAQAADMSLKAPAKQQALAPVYCTTTSCVSWFVGGTMLSGGGTFDVVSTGLNGLAQNDFAMGGQGGFEFFRSSYYAAIVGHIETDVALNGMPGGNFANRLTYGVCGRLGYSLAGLLGATTSGTAQTPTLPAQLMSSLMTPYVNICEDKRHNQPAVATGIGVEALIAADALGRSAWTLNLDYLNYQYNQGGTSGAIAGLPTTQNSENVLKASLNYHFGP